MERLDAVIRIGHLQDSSLISTRIASDQRLMIAAPSYLLAHGMPSLEGLPRQQLLDKLHGADLMGWRHVIGCPTTHLPDCATVFRCDDFEALRQAALRGMGIAILPEWVIGPDVREKRLVRLPFDPVAPEGDAGIHILRALAKPSPNLRVFLAAMRAHVGTPPIWSHDCEPTAAQIDAVPAMNPPPEALERPTC